MPAAAAVPIIGTLIAGLTEISRAVENGYLTSLQGLARASELLKATQQEMLASLRQIEADIAAGLAAAEALPAQPNPPTAPASATVPPTVAPIGATGALMPPAAPAGTETSPAGATSAAPSPTAPAQPAGPQPTGVE